MCFWPLQCLTIRELHDDLDSHLVWWIPCHKEALNCSFLVQFYHILLPLLLKYVEMCTPPHVWQQNSSSCFLPVDIGYGLMGYRYRYFILWYILFYPHVMPRQSCLARPSRSRPVLRPSLFGLRTKSSPQCILLTNSVTADQTWRHRFVKKPYITRNQAYMWFTGKKLES